jgi:glutamine synthetase
MPTTPDDLARDRVFGLIRASGAQMVDVRFCDLPGRWRHLTIPSDQFNERIFTDGIPLEASRLPGSPADAELVLRPDPHTPFLDPFAQVPTLAIIADLVPAGGGDPFPLDPRSVARRAEAHLTASGLAENLMLLPEFEFYVFEVVRYRNLPHAAGYVVESTEGEWNTYRRAAEGYQPSNVNPRAQGFDASPPRDTLHFLRSEMVSRLKEVGVGVRSHHHEVGGPGQCEITILPLPLLRAADTVLLVKSFVRMTAQANDRVASFLPKPIHEEAGSGLHVHQFLAREGRSLFHDPEGWNGLSETALHYAGGLLEHAAALCAFTNPSTMSYKRLLPGWDAPILRTMDLTDPTAAVRVPATARPEEEMRLEYRPPDGTCNMYLAAAAMLLAGMDGIQRRLDPREMGLVATARRRRRPPRLPFSLEEALAALERDHEFLLQGGVFSETLLEEWIRLKWDEEIAEVRTRPHPYEFHLYLDL